jgi:hypothetical protein
MQTQTSIIKTKEPAITKTTVWIVTKLCGNECAEKLRKKLSVQKKRRAARKLFCKENKQRQQECMPPLTFNDWSCRRCLHSLLEKSDSEVPWEQKRAIVQTLNYDELLRLEKHLQENFKLEISLTTLLKGCIFPLIQE